MKILSATGSRIDPSTVGPCLRARYPSTVSVSPTSVPIATPIARVSASP